MLYVSAPMLPIKEASAVNCLCSLSSSFYLCLNAYTLYLTRKFAGIYLAKLWHLLDFTLVVGQAACYV